MKKIIYNDPDNGLGKAYRCIVVYFLRDKRRIKGI